MDKSFVILCASIVFNNQRSIFDENYIDNKSGRNRAFRDIFLDIINKGYIKVNPKFSEYIFLYKSTLNDDLLYFQLGKELKLETYRFDEKAFEQRSVSSYPPLDVFVNLNTQQIAVEIKETVLKLDSILPTIQKLFSLFIKQKNFSIFFNTLENITEFWQVVDSKNSDSINEILFEMIVPNYFGISGAAEQLVGGAKEKINADTVVLSFKNKKGALNAKIADLDSYVKYSATSGSWKVKLKKDGYVRTIKSSDFSLRKQIEKSIIETVSSFNDNDMVNEHYQDCVKQIMQLFNGENNYE